MTNFVLDDFITGNKFKQICDDYIDESKSFLDISKRPKIIFCYTDWVELFTHKILPHIDYQFKFITHNADRPISSSFLSLLDDSRLIKWYGMNCHIQHKKLVPIPIGIANEKWPHGNKETLVNFANQENEKRNLVYSNFQIHTNPLVRNNVSNIIKTKSFIDHEQSTLEFKDYLKKLSGYKFVISPAGNSIDCHRIWEALYLGVIPIVQEHPALYTFKDLPIMFVKSFEDLKEDELMKFSENSIKDFLKCRFSYYKNLILGVERVEL